MKVLLIWDRVGDYHRARITALENLLGKENVFSADIGDEDSLYNWQSTQNNENHYCLSIKSVEEKDITTRLKNLIKIIKKNKISHIALSGYGRSIYILYILLLKIWGKKVILFAESWYPSAPLTELFKSVFLRLFCDAVFASGERAKIHFTENLLIQAHRVKTGYSVVDNKHFTRKPTYTKPEVKKILCIARFNEVKNIDTLIRAYNRSAISKTYKLQIVGGGPLLSRFQKYGQENKNIKISEWVDYQVLPQIYHQATVFVLPSVFEPWGLVINEAMAAGLPIIASSLCGCIPELVDEKNGFIFNARTIEDLVEVFDYFAQLPDEQIEKLGKNSTEKIAAFTPQTWAETLISFHKKK